MENKAATQDQSTDRTEFRTDPERGLRAAEAQQACDARCHEITEARPASGDAWDQFNNYLVTPDIAALLALLGDRRRVAICDVVGTPNRVGQDPRRAGAAE